LALARARAMQVELDTTDTVVRLAIRDDGIGGADPARGSGLTGLVALLVARVRRVHLLPYVASELDGPFDDQPSARNAAGVRRRPVFPYEP
jgi:hypothetical protein